MVFVLDFILENKLLDSLSVTGLKISNNIMNNALKEESPRVTLPCCSRDEYECQQFSDD